MPNISAYGAHTPALISFLANLTGGIFAKPPMHVTTRLKLQVGKTSTSRAKHTKFGTLFGS